MSTEDILKERGQIYGSFEGNASIAQKLKRIWNQNKKAGSVGCEVTEAVINEGMTMILHKIARITNGDPTYADSWADIAGYAQLVANHLNKEPAVSKGAPCEMTKEQVEQKVNYEIKFANRCHHG